MKKFCFIMTYISLVFVVCFLVIEMLLRMSIFCPVFKIEKLRHPELYAGYSDDDDYWKLYYRFDGAFKPATPTEAHPVLGWSQTEIDKENPLGLEHDTLNNLLSSKLHVMFYGDSFVKGRSSPDYFICTYMTKHLNNAVVVDLGVGGYGLDQIFLMFKLTYNKVMKPYVLIGVLCDDDLDRSVLTVRMSQKPRFILKNGELSLTGVPIDIDQKRFFETHPVEIKSYFFRYLLRNLLSGFSCIRDHLSKINEKIQINTRIIEEIKRLSDNEGTPLEFVLFYAPRSLQRVTWQEKFLKDKLNELQIPFIDTKTLLLNYAKENNIDTHYFYSFPNGHHNDLGNQIIANGLLSELSRRYGIR